MKAVSLRNVSKSFGALDVIKDVSVDIEPGEFCVLIGPSGSGKSTLLRIIAGLEELTSGQVHIGNRDVTNLAAKQRDIAMVFQSYALYPQMTVRQNLSFALRLAGRPKAEIQQKTDDVARMLELTKLLERLPKELSGGQRQRVAMGRAIVRNPAVFLFDEPLSNLDAKLRGQVRGEIRDLHQRLQTTSVYVTHDQVEAMTMGQKVVVLRDGRVEQAGRPLDLYDRPSNVFVAGFIGSPPINLHGGQVEGERIHLKGGVELPVPAGYRDLRGRQIILGLRPEHLKPVDPSTPGAIPATVHAVESTGSETIVICDSPVGRIQLASKQRSDLQDGQRIALASKDGEVLLFDRQSERRIVGNGCTTIQPRVK